MGKFFLCYIVLFLLKLPPPARPGTTCIDKAFNKSTRKQKKLRPSMPQFWTLVRLVVNFRFEICMLMMLLDAADADAAGASDDAGHAADRADDASDDDADALAIHMAWILDFLMG